MQSLLYATSLSPRLSHYMAFTLKEAGLASSCMQFDSMPLVISAILRREQTSFQELTGYKHLQLSPVKNWGSFVTGV
jgi:hypothetical protein